MNQQAVDPSASDNNAEEQALVSTTFHGFEPLNSNYVYCPNQFFDVCLKSRSRGMVRIVAYVLRQTLGWLDQDGKPVNQTVKVSYNDLIAKAGVSRGAIKKALQQAVALGFLDCQQEGIANSQNISGQSAQYTLRWDSGDYYQTSIGSFTGFFAGQGNRTPIPNSFFDIVVPTRSLAVTKVVGAIIRNSVGYQNQFGHRHQTVALSYSSLMKHTCLSDRSTLSSAIKESLDAGFIRRVEEGIFDQKTKVQSAAEYGIKWLSAKPKPVSGSKTRPEKCVDNEGFKNQTRNGSKNRPEERFKNQTCIEKKENTTNKQQNDVVEKTLIQKLKAVGFSADIAKSLISSRGVEAVTRQLRWIDARKPRNKLAMLRRAIENDWEAPEQILHKEKLAKNRDRLNRESEKLIEVDRLATENKRSRIERKNELLAIWSSVSSDTRQQLIESAATRATGERLSKIIRRQSPESECPARQVLDELARVVANSSTQDPMQL